MHAALLSSAIMAVVSILDSHLVSKRLPGVRAFMLVVGGLHFIYALVLSRLIPLPADAGSAAVSIAVLSSVIRTGAIVILLDGLRHREVATVIPLVYTYPVFVAVFAFVLLDERLAWQQFAAIAIVVLGGVLIALNSGQRGSRWSGRARCSSARQPAFAVADVTGKVALERITFWNLFWIGALVMGAAFLLISLRRSVMFSLVALRERGKMLAVVTFNELIAPVGMIISYWALARGPVSLVSRCSAPDRCSSSCSHWC